MFWLGKDSKVFRFPLSVFRFPLLPDFKIAYDEIIFVRS